MEKSIKLFGIPNDQYTNKARDEINQLGVVVEEFYCPPSTQEWYQLPFIKDECGKKHYGIQSIKHFVGQRLEK